MAVCRRCRATVTPAQTEDGQRVELEPYSEPVGERYVIVSYETDPFTVRPVDGSSPVDGYLDHRERCPA